jgi:hypothetical protein
MHFPSVTNSVLARWIAFLLRVWKVPDSNFDPDNDCLYWGLSQFFSMLPRKYRDNEKKLTRKVVRVDCMKACRGVEV